MQASRDDKVVCASLDVDDYGCAVRLSSAVRQESATRQSRSCSTACTCLRCTGTSPFLYVHVNVPYQPICVILPNETWRWHCVPLSFPARFLHLRGFLRRCTGSSVLATRVKPLPRVLFRKIMSLHFQGGAKVLATDRQFAECHQLQQNTSAAIASNSDTIASGPGKDPVRKSWSRLW